MTQLPNVCEICLGIFMDQHGTERPSSPHLKNFTLLLLKKYSTPGTALKQFCFLWSWYLLSKEQDEYFQAPEDQLVSH